MTTLFKQVLNCMEENNDQQDCDFSTWHNAQEAIEAYGDNLVSDCSEKEVEATVKALNLVIDSGEKSMYEEVCQKAITEWNIEIWGNDFGNNSGSVPFGG